MPLKLSAVPRAEIASAAWDRLVLESRDGWLFHTNLWAAASGERGRDRSFAVVDGQGALLALACLRSEWAPAAGPLSLPRLYNGRAGLAHAATLEPAQLEAADAFALARIRRLGWRTGSALINWELPPMCGDPIGPRARFAQAGFRFVSYPAKALDLDASEAQLFARLASRARRDVRRARRGGVQVAAAASADDVEVFARLHRTAMGERGAAPRAERAFRQLWQQLAPRGACEVLLARSAEGEPASGILTLSYKGTTYYQAAASAPAHRALGGNTLLVWEAIARARDAGQRLFHLGPTPRREQVSEKAFNVGRFKDQFGGRSLDWPIGDLPLWPGLGWAMKGARLLRARRAAPSDGSASTPHSGEPR